MGGSDLWVAVVSPGVRAEAMQDGCRSADLGMRGGWAGLVFDPQFMGGTLSPHSRGVS